MREGYTMTPQELRGLQLIELEILCEIFRICQKHKITCLLSAGSLLGAVRHGGFIPWDDDADISFLRKDYELFREACKTDLNNDKFYFQDQDLTPGYRWGYGKLRRKDTLFIRLGQEHMPYEQGIFVDLFPADYVSNSYFGRCVTNFICFLLRKAFWSEVGKYNAKGFEKAAYYILSLIPEKTLKTIYRKYIERHRKPTAWFRTLLFPTPTKDYGYKTVWRENPQEIEFEGIKFLTHGDIDGILSFKYGEYKQLPPVEKRKVHPISCLKLPEG